MHLRQQAFYTSVEREPLFLIGFMPATSAENLFCGLRIQIRHARLMNQQKRYLNAMAWLGLNSDEGPYFQAQRVDLHREMVLKLIKEDKAYYCTCTAEELEAKRKQALAEGKKPKYDGTCRDKKLNKSANSVVRFRGKQDGVTIVEDLIKGNIIFNNEELDDLIIERGDGYPTYNFAVVIDDALMNITHVIRGDDHVNNTPRQILMYQALGFDVPKFAHVPMILEADKTRLSKRTWCNFRHGLQGDGFPAGSARQLSGTPRLVAWRSGNFFAFTIG